MSRVIRLTGCCGMALAASLALGSGPAVPQHTADVAFRTASFLDVEDGVLRGPADVKQGTIAKPLQ